MLHSNTKMARVIASPTIGSASAKPSQIQMTPSTTASEVKPSVRAWMPINAAANSLVPIEI